MVHKSVHMSVNRLEFRRDRRHPVPPVILRILDHDYPTANWSLSGAQFSAHDLGLRVADSVAGTLLMPETGNSFEFSAVIVWADSQQGTVGARFDNLSLHAVEMLDRYISQWLRRSARR
jgi:predicted Rdx family selenoprotein